MQVLFAVVLFCKLEVLQEAISLVKGSLKRRCVASCKKQIASCGSALRQLNALSLWAEETGNFSVMFCWLRHERSRKCFCHALLED